MSALISLRGAADPQFAQPEAAVEQAGGAKAFISLEMGDGGDRPPLS